jgi:hypothetical protein
MELRRRVLHIILSMETTKRTLLRSVGEPIEHPGHWVVEGKVEGGDDDGHTWSVVRKPDGTWWYVNTHIFPRDGGTLRFDFNEQITDKRFIQEYEKEFHRGQTAVKVQG